MFGECHAHIFMNGRNYSAAVAEHKKEPNESRIREYLQAYQDAGVSFVRDGGDHFGATVLARTLAEEYGIDYRTPVFAIHRTGHYGGIVGREAQSLREVHALVREVRAHQGDFIKIMVSGIMDYAAYGKLSEEPPEKDWIAQTIHIAHEEGFAVMAHANGRDAVLAAAEAGADSIEHGNYIDGDCLQAMKEHGCIWVPTIATTGNLIGCGRYDDGILQKIYDAQSENLRSARELGVTLALGSDAGAYMVPHGAGIASEYAVFRNIFADVPAAALEDSLLAGERRIAEIFRYRA